MTSLKTLSLFGLSALLLATSVYSPVDAQGGPENPLTEQKIAAIRVNCNEAQSILQRVQRNDIVTRTHRGRRYETVLSLMASFNSRAALNQINEPRLVQATAQLQTAFMQFYDHYTKHQDDLEAVLEVDCVAQPEVFYQNLVTARESRAILSTDVTEMSVLIDEYANVVREIGTTLALRSESQGER